MIRVQWRVHDAGGQAVVAVQRGRPSVEIPIQYTSPINTELLPHGNWTMVSTDTIALVAHEFRPSLTSGGVIR